MKVVGDAKDTPPNPQSPGPVQDAQVNDPSEAAPSADQSAELRAEMEKFKDLAYRAAAELENYRRRAAKEREDAVAALKERLVSRMLPIVDGFDLAAEAAANVSDDAQKTYVDGYRAIGRQMLSTLESMGLSVIDIPADAEFHPGEQEAVMTEEVPGLKSPMVLQVLQMGYRLDGRLLRPARVKVGMPPDLSELDQKEVKGHG